MYKISDALSLPFSYGSGNVSGSRKVTIPSPLGFDIDITMEACKTFSHEGGDGLLVHLSQDLYVVVYYFYNVGTVSMYFINAAKLKFLTPEECIDPTSSLREVLIRLQEAIVASYLWKNNIWRQLELPSIKIDKNY